MSARKMVAFLFCARATRQPHHVVVASVNMLGKLGKPGEMIAIAAAEIQQGRDFGESTAFEVLAQRLLHIAAAFP